MAKYNNYTGGSTQMAQAIENGDATYATENTPRAQRITNGLEHAAQKISVPVSASMKKWIKFYFNILLHDTIDETITTIPSDVEGKVQGLREVVQLRPFSETEKSTIKRYADRFGYTYTPITATPTTKAPENIAPLAANNVKKTNYQTIATIAIVVIVAIVSFFLFRKKKR